MKCTVCKMNKAPGEGRRSWVFTSERTPITKVQVIFKLFEFTKTEFSAGSLCPVCYNLVAQIDGLSFQVQQISKALRARISCCATEEDYIATHANDGSDEDVDDAEESEADEDDFAQNGPLETPVPPKQKRVLSPNSIRGYRKRPGSTKNLDLKLRVKKEKREDLNEDDSCGERDNVDLNHFLLVEQPIKEEDDDDEDDDAAAGSRKTRSHAAEPNRAPENLDFNLTTTKTTRGHEQLVYEGYTYLKTTHQPQGCDLAKWKCSAYYSSKSGCRAKLNTTLDGLCVLLDSKTEHNHPPPSDRQLKVILFREQIKQIAINHPDMKPSEILQSAQMLHDTPVALGMKDESIMRYIQRIKSKNKQQLAILGVGNVPGDDLEAEGNQCNVVSRLHSVLD